MSEFDPTSCGLKEILYAGIRSRVRSPEPCDSGIITECSMVELCVIGIDHPNM
ncbi:MAG: hypothetical protein HUJ51_00615 [Eggerthellaceae bacterium]|nr:hypothetical protein [Eggerthellaceae bacterium]